jgi:hypothetical protein
MTNIIRLPDLRDPISQWLLGHGFPITRENWIRTNYAPDDPPAEWPAEHEAELPERDTL